jgi:hypothetical protein
MAAVAEFENQDWVQDIIQVNSNSTTEKVYVDPNVAFPFQDNFSVGTIHSTNAVTKKSNTQQETGNKSNEEEVIKILDNNDEDDVSFLTTKTQDKLAALLVQARKQLSGASDGSRVASGSDLSPRSSPAIMHSQINAGGQESIFSNSAPSGTDGNGVGGNVSSGLGGK